MYESFKKLVEGYQRFRAKYVSGDRSAMLELSEKGQSPSCMVIACSDSRVDPSIILQCDPGDLFVVRNVANIVPTYEQDMGHHGVSAALEFGIAYLQVKHLIILGHSQCAGIHARVNCNALGHNDFISNWVSLLTAPVMSEENPDEYAKKALKNSAQNCLTFPWIEQKVAQQQLTIHTWFFDIKTGLLLTAQADSWCELINAEG